MSSVIYLVTTPHYGGTGGTAFNDSPLVKDFSTVAINKIIVGYGSRIESLEIFYSWNNGSGTTRGSGGTKVELTFGLDEFITKIQGRTDDEYITQLTFITNKRNFGPYGGEAGKDFTLSVNDVINSHSAPHTRLLAFSGHASSYIYGLQGIFAEYRKNTSEPKLYESMPAHAQPDSPVFISKFASHLATPTVTLFVGEPKQKVEFHAHEDTLCQLPFFKAALLGEFQEALQKTIDMLDDDPSEVSALIEYLYTANYTYTYNPTTAHFQEGCNIPTGDLTEGLFHVGVYAIGNKYICPELVKIATRNFWTVLPELGDIQKLRLLKAAYDEGISLPRRKHDFPGCLPAEGLIRWIDGLFSEHSEEMEKAMSECPTLACDLLRVATCLN